MIEFLRKFENCGSKSGRVNSILFTKSINLQFLFCPVLGVRCDVDIFKLPAGAQSINREVYGTVNELPHAIQYCTSISERNNGFFKKIKVR